jgi:hypothetical protein
MQDADLFAQHPSDSEQRLNQGGQVGQVVDQLFDGRGTARLRNS